MKLLGITIKNFGIFGGTHIITFSSIKPLTLIYGMNGRGKTTVVEAVLFAIYGQRSFMFKQSGASISDYVKSRIHNGSLDDETYVELEFQIGSEAEATQYRIRRKWGIESKRIAVTAWKNNVENPTIRQNWDLMIENLLPASMAPFFFIDGETLSRLADSELDCFLAESLAAFDKIRVIDFAINDLDRVVRKATRTLQEESVFQGLHAYDIEIQHIDKELKKAKEDSGYLKVKQQRIENKLIDAENEYSSIGGSINNNREKLLEEHANLQNQLRVENDCLIEIASGDAPLMLVMPHLKKIGKNVIKERKNRNFNLVIEQLPELLNAYEANKGEKPVAQWESFLNFLQDQKVSETSFSFDMSDDGILRLQSLCCDLEKSVKEDFASSKANSAAHLEAISEIERLLSIRDDEDRVQGLYRRVLDLNTELATINEQLRSSQELEAILTTKCEKLHHEKNQLIENTIASIESSDDAKRIIKYSGITSEILKVLKGDLQRSIIKELAVTITQCLHILISKKNLVERVEIGEERLELQWLNRKGEKLIYDGFSAGERQLLVTAILWALRLTTRKSFPLVMDTPLARLDSQHRKTLVSKFYPDASHQTILLTTDKEIDDELYLQLVPYVGQSYTLEFDDARGKTDIRAGWFGGDSK